MKARNSNKLLPALAVSAALTAGVSAAHAQDALIPGLVGGLAGQNQLLELGLGGAPLSSLFAGSDINTDLLNGLGAPTEIAKARALLVAGRPLSALALVRGRLGLADVDSLTALHLLTPAQLRSLTTADLNLMLVNATLAQTPLAGLELPLGEGAELPLSDVEGPEQLAGNDRQGTGPRGLGLGLLKNSNRGVRGHGALNDLDGATDGLNDVVFGDNGGLAALAPVARIHQIDAILSTEGVEAGLVAVDHTVSGALVHQQGIEVAEGAVAETGDLTAAAQLGGAAVDLLSVDTEGKRMGRASNALLGLGAELDSIEVAGGDVASVEGTYADVLVSEADLSLAGLDTQSSNITGSPERILAGVGAGTGEIRVVDGLITVDSVDAGAKIAEIDLGKNGLNTTMSNLQSGDADRFLVVAGAEVGSADVADGQLAVDSLDAGVLIGEVDLGPQGLQTTGSNLAGTPDNVLVAAGIRSGEVSTDSGLANVDKGVSAGALIGEADLGEDGLRTGRMGQFADNRNTFALVAANTGETGALQDALEVETMDVDAVIGELALTTTEGVGENGAALSINGDQASEPTDPTAGNGGTANGGDLAQDNASANGGNANGADAGNGSDANTGTGGDEAPLFADNGNNTGSNNGGRVDEETPSETGSDESNSAEQVASNDGETGSNNTGSDNNTVADNNSGMSDEQLADSNTGDNGNSDNGGRVDEESATDAGSEKTASGEQVASNDSEQGRNAMDRNAADRDAADENAEDYRKEALAEAEGLDRATCMAYFEERYYADMGVERLEENLDAECAAWEEAYEGYQMATEAMGYGAE